MTGKDVPLSITLSEEEFRAFCDRCPAGVDALQYLRAFALGEVVTGPSPRERLLLETIQGQRNKAMDENAGLRVALAVAGADLDKLSTALAEARGNAGQDQRDVVREPPGLSPGDASPPPDRKGSSEKTTRRVEMPAPPLGG